MRHLLRTCGRIGNTNELESDTTILALPQLTSSLPAGLQQANPHTPGLPLKPSAHSPPPVSGSSDARSEIRPKNLAPIQATRATPALLRARLSRPDATFKSFILHREHHTTPAQPVVFNVALWLGGGMTGRGRSGQKEKTTTATTNSVFLRGRHSPPPPHYRKLLEDSTGAPIAGNSYLKIQSFD